MNGIPTVAISGVPDPLPEGLTVLDVREPVEWSYGHVAGSVHIPMAEVPTRLEEVPDGQVLVVCKVGARSARVAGYLVQQGRDAVNLDLHLQAGLSGDRGFHGRFHRAGYSDVIVLDQHTIVEAHAVVLGAAHPRRIFVQQTKARDGLAGV